jgi:hypothetical protein
MPPVMGPTDPDSVTVSTGARSRDWAVQTWIMSAPASVAT